MTRKSNKEIEQGTKAPETPEVETPKDNAPEVENNQEEAPKDEEETKAPETKGVEKKGSAPASKKEEKAKPNAEEEARVDKILKMYPQYAELYIDSKGGVYTVNTPDTVRGKAKLYKNKYHK
jgi:hypothetical protein